MPGTFEENRRKTAEALLRIHQKEEMRRGLARQVLEELREREGIDGRAMPGYNPRLSSSFGPSPGDADPEASAAEFARLYAGYGRGTPEDRAPFLEHIFKRFDEAVLDLDPDRTEDMAARYEEMQEPCQTLVCYEEVRRAHPKEFAAHYDTPAKRQALDAKIDLSAVQSAYLLAYARVHGINGEIKSEAEVEDVCAGPAEPSPEALEDLAQMGNKLRMEREKGRILRDISEERVPAPVRLRITRETAPARGISPAVFNLDKLRRSEPGGARTRGAEAEAADLFDNTFSVLLEPRGVLAQNAAELGITDPFQMIYIDGQPAAEAFAERTAGMSPQERNREMKLAVTGAMLSGTHRLEMAAAAYDAHGALQVTVTPVRPDVRAVQPSAKEEGHGWLRRAFDWGPFKIPTRQDKLDALERNDPQQAARQEAIVQQVQGKFLNEELRQMEVQREATRQTRERVHQFTQEVQRYGADRLEPLIYGLVSLVDLNGAGVSREDPSYGAEFENQGQLPDGTRIVNTLDRAPSRSSFAMLCLLAEGHTLDEMDPDTEQGQALLRHGGERAMELLSAAREDPAKADQVRQMGIDGMKQLLREPYPDVDPANPESVARAAGRADMMASLAQDATQIFPGEQMRAYSNEYAGIEDQIGGLAYHLQAVGNLGSYYASDLYRDQRAPAEDKPREPKIVREALRARLLLERVQPREPGLTLGDVSASIGGMMAIHTECGEEAVRRADPYDPLGLAMVSRELQDPAFMEAGRRRVAPTGARAPAGTREHTSFAEMAAARQPAGHGAERSGGGRPRSPEPKPEPAPVQREAPAAPARAGRR